MKTPAGAGGLVPARITWGSDGTPEAPDFGDFYHPPIGSHAQARHVFIGGNDLPARWAGRDDFTVAETGFGLGNNFLATWQAWRDDPARPRRLHHVGIDAHPPTPADLRRAHADSGHPDLSQQLIDAWPPLVPGVHRLLFEGGAVQLTLAFGDVRHVLPALAFQADAFYLDGFAPDRNPAMWDRSVIRALSRRAAVGATAATWSVARTLRDNLSAAGFDWTRRPGIGGKREVLSARFSPRHAVRPVHAPAIGERQAVVVGAGLAGACTAAALAAQGFEVTVLDRHPAPAGDSSGNPAGLFHATVHGDDGAYARLFRAGALRTARLLRSLPTDAVPHQTDGLLRLELSLGLDDMHARLNRLGLPNDLVQALSADEASRRAGVRVSAPCWFYPQGGWVAPSALVQHLLCRTGVRFVGSAHVHALRQQGLLWQCLGASGDQLAAAPQIVLANAEQANPLLATVGGPQFEWTRNRGQISVFQPPPGAPALNVPVAGAGYALPLPGGRLLCGASTRVDGDDTTLRAEDHHQNAARLQGLIGMAPPADVAAWQGRVGWRVQADDRLPAAGPVPMARSDPSLRLDQARLVPRMAGLHLVCALGARGITLAPLLGEVVAARIAGSPVPLEQSLFDHVDPARWIVRQARRAPV